MEPPEPHSRRIVSNMCTSEECGACAGGGVRIANWQSPIPNLPPGAAFVSSDWQLAIGNWKWASNHANADASYTARDAALW